MLSKDKMFIIILLSPAEVWVINTCKAFKIFRLEELEGQQHVSFPSQQLVLVVKSEP